MNCKLFFLKLFSFLIIIPLSNNAKTSHMKEEATFGAGCFWCVEAIFSRLEGVESVKPGYAGGHIKNPAYKEVCTGRTGHAEVCRIVFDPSVISFNELLDVFWNTHDPTTLNRQGNDVGTQYRSVVFYHTDDQRKAAKQFKEKLNKSGKWDDPIVTEISPIENFYYAEDYHNDYYENNKEQPYCSFVIDPKVKKFEKTFKDKLSRD
jgi:peptide-methionine (S)-S-oxide reductase